MRLFRSALQHVPAIKPLFSLVLSVVLLRLTPSPCQGETVPAPVALANGLRIVMRSRSQSPLVALDLWVRAGSGEETASEEGCAHFLEHVLFKGTTTRKPGQIDADFERLGGTLNAATGPDYARFYGTVPQEALEPALRILADVVQNAILPAEEVERERGVILDELVRDSDSLIPQMTRQLYAQAYPDHPYSRSPGGSPEAIQKRTREEMLAFYRRCYRPERCVLALAGGFAPDTLKQTVDRVFGSWMLPASALPKSKAQQTGTTSRPSESKTISQTLLPASHREEGRIGVAFRAPMASNTGASCAVQIVEVLLGDGRSGRLASGVLAGSDAEALYIPRREPSLLSLSVSVPVRTPPEASLIEAKRREGALLAAMRGLQEHPPSPGELQWARRRILNRMRYEEETLAGLARAIGYAEITGGDSPEKLRERLRTVTVADIIAFVKSATP